MEMGPSGLGQGSVTEMTWRRESGIANVTVSVTEKGRGGEGDLALIRLLFVFEYKE